MFLKNKRTRKLQKPKKFRRRMERRMRIVRRFRDSAWSFPKYFPLRNPLISGLVLSIIYRLNFSSYRERDEQSKNYLIYYTVYLCTSCSFRDGLILPKKTQFFFPTLHTLVVDILVAALSHFTLGRRSSSSPGPSTLGPDQSPVGGRLRRSAVHGRHLLLVNDFQQTKRENSPNLLKIYRGILI